MTLLKTGNGLLQFVLALAIVGSSTTQIDAQQKKQSVSQVVSPRHLHTPIRINARPILKSYDISLNEPRRMALDSKGNLWVVNWGAGTLQMIDAEDSVLTVASNLNEPSGLALGNGGDIFVSIHAGGLLKAGSVLRISADGERSVYADGLTGPTDLTFDKLGNLFVACFHDNSIVKVDPMSNVSTFVTDIPSPAAVTFDKTGNLFTVSSTEGILYKISVDGELSELSRNLDVPSDLAFDNRGHLIVTNFAGTELTYVNKRGISRTFAFVPKGTIAVEFDNNGNVLLLNWDENSLVKVMSTLTVPCPHCNRPIPLKFRPTQKMAPTQPETKNPAI